MTFSQNFQSLAYNVTAVEQADENGTGPAYLLNGLTPAGYWYQVGLSWQWALLNGGHATGFNANYEVFDSSGKSVFPSDGGGGLANLSGVVNPGDSVLLSLSFSGGNVSMQVLDWNSGSFASVSYSAANSTEFEGSTASVANANGFFTGLMTEEYHVSPYYGGEQKVVYSDLDFALSSAWMWIDEYNVNTSSVLFFQNTGSLITYTPANQTHAFSFDGATESSNAYSFTTGTPSSVSVTLSYEILGGGSPLSEPQVTYVSNGLTVTTDIGTAPTTLRIDYGTTYSVSTILEQSNSERWILANNETEIALTQALIVYEYYHQFLLSVSYQVIGGGSGYGSPSLVYFNMGSQISSQISGSPIWADAGSTWVVPSELGGSNSAERWYSNSTDSGTITSVSTTTITYYHEFYVSVDYSLKGGNTNLAPNFSSSSLGKDFATKISNSSYWLDAGAFWSATPVISASSSERWVAENSNGTISNSPISVTFLHQYHVSFEYYLQGFSNQNVSPTLARYSSLGTNASSTANSTQWADASSKYNYPSIINASEFERWITSEANGTISGSEILVSYVHQFYVKIAQSPGGLANVSSGWFNATMLYISESSESGWKATGFLGTGSGSYSGNNSTAFLQVQSPITETPIFDPSVTIESSNGGSISYAYAASTGMVSGGSISTISVAPNSTISLSATPSSFLYSFAGWSGFNTGKSSEVAVVVDSPLTMTSTFSFNYTIALIIAVVTALIVAIIVVFVRRKVSRPESLL
jgi:hypothetical protein